MKTRILLCDDHKMVREGIKLYLEEEDQYKIVAEAANGNEALSLIEEHHPELILTDINMPDLDGIGLTKQIKKQFPEIKVLALSADNEGTQIQRVMEAGADGFVAKDCSPYYMVHAMDEVMKERNFLSCESIIKVRKEAKTKKFNKRKLLGYLVILGLAELLINLLIGNFF